MNQANQIQPVLDQLETILDQFGADFSVQDTSTQASEFV